MKKLFIPLISVILNVYFVLAWMYSYHAFGAHPERVNAFLRYIPKGFSVGSLSIFLVLLSIISVFILAKSELRSWIKALFLFVQGLFTSLMIWQLL